VTFTAGQRLANLVFVDAASYERCCLVTDSTGNQLLVATRKMQQPSESADQPVESTLEVMVIDLAGRILDRKRLPFSTFLGKLPEPLGNADQLVFGVFGYQPNTDGTTDRRAFGPGTICIIENGRLNPVRKLDPPQPPSDQTVGDDSQ
jgi:hypothetical protein